LARPARESARAVKTAPERPAANFGCINLIDGQEVRQIRVTRGMNAANLDYSILPHP
jgi:hypothetical protein